MMNRLFIAAIILLCCCVGAAEPPPDFGRPVLVTIGRSPWAMVMGAESASFVLYDNRVALFIGKRDDRAQRLKATLSKESYESFLRAALDTDALDATRAHTTLTAWTDQPTTELIYRRADGQLRRMTVYGSFGEDGRSRGASAPAASTRKQDVVDAVPASVLRALQTANRFASERAEPWSPEFIEVMIWDYHYAPDADLPWPAKWPGLSHPMTKKMGGPYNSHSLFLPSSEEEALLQLMKSRREKQAVLIDGKKWSISMRRPVPREEEWQNLPYRE